MSTKTDKNAEPVEKIVCVDSDSASEEECVDAEPAQPKITSLSEAIKMLDDLAEFAERRLQDKSLVSSLIKLSLFCHAKFENSEFQTKTNQ